MSPRDASDQDRSAMPPETRAALVEALAQLLLADTEHPEHYDNEPKGAR